MDDVVSRRGARGAVLGLIAFMAVGCAHTHDSLEQRLAAVEAELAVGKRGDRAVAVRLDDVESRMLLLSDQVETRQTVLYRDRQVPDLPTVRLSPEPPPGRRVAATREEPFEYQHLDDYGRVLSAEQVGLAPPADPGSALAMAPPTAPPPAPRVALDPKTERKVARAYKKAIVLTRAGKFVEAQKKLEKFVERYPTHQLADNAVYWLGECLYAQKLYMEALQAFQKVIRDYPDGNKVPDAMLKTGLCYQNLGEGAQARKVLVEVTEFYPGSPAARIALERAHAMH